MSITREQVADLQPGDVVEMHVSSYPDVILRGPLHAGGPEGRSLYLGWVQVTWGDGKRAHGDSEITVISRASRLYVNHDRTEPVPGDVVRDADGVTWLRDTWKTWHSPDSTCGAEHQDTGLVHPLNLLVDGETGQVVP